MISRLGAICGDIHSNSLNNNPKSGTQGRRRKQKIMIFTLTTPFFKKKIKIVASLNII
jgi:hypothetical protein